jgi:glycosyltransferase involved in cell wall biosynthesis
LKVSVAIAAFEGGRFLRQQLESIAGQTLLPDQQVIVDDRSSDDTADIAREFARNAPFEVLVEVNAARLGVALNFDRALGLTDGDLVFLCDPDDVWFPGKIAEIHDAAARMPAIACWMVDALLTDADLNPNGSTKLENIRLAGLPESWMVMGCCAAFRRGFLDLALPIPPDQPAHDNWLIQFADLIGVIVRLEQPMQYYRRHGGNASQVAANRLTRPGAPGRLAARIRDALRRLHATDGLRLESAFFDAALIRMEQRPQLLARLAGPRADGIVHAASRRARLLRGRLAIRALPLHRRPIAVIRLFVSGGYRESGGFGGSLKDLLAG